jgi:hypothetical protein
MRPRLPLLWQGKELIAAGSDWVDRDFAAAPGQQAFAVVWQPPVRLR